jgi:hypothetical protein
VIVPDLSTWVPTARRTSTTQQRRRRRLPLLLAAVAVLALGWLLTPTPIPLYDGVGMPDEPYRFVVPPAGYRTTAPPSEARAAIAVAGGISCCELEARSDEQGPQVSVYIPRSGLAVPGTTEVTLLASPAPAPAGPAPQADGRFEGNTYRITAEGPQGPATLTPEANRATVQLRALNGNQPGPSLWYRSGDGAAWRQLPSAKVGFDIIEAQFAGPGDYVLVRGKQSGGGTVKVLLGILAVPALLVVVLVVLRIRNGPADDGDRDDGNERDDADDTDTPDDTDAPDDPAEGRRAT